MKVSPKPPSWSSSPMPARRGSALIPWVREVKSQKAELGSLCATTPATSHESPATSHRIPSAILRRMAAGKNEKLFLVDAMGYIFRAFYAPMERLQSPSGMPTKVPYLFANMMRRLMKEYDPHYLAVVFDTSAPTFRDKLFAQYKAKRPPMPEDLSIQLPYVRKLCEACACRFCSATASRPTTSSARWRTRRQRNRSTFS